MAVLSSVMPHSFFMLVLKIVRCSLNHKIITSQKLRGGNDTVKIFQRHLSVVTSNEQFVNNLTIMPSESVLLGALGFMLDSLFWRRCWIMMHKHFKDNVLMWNVTFCCFIPKCFAFCHVLSVWSLSCLMKMEYQCLFHETYESCLNRKYIIVVPMLDKCRRLFFVSNYATRWSLRSLMLLQYIPPTTSNSINHFCLLCPP